MVKRRWFAAIAVLGAVFFVLGQAPVHGESGRGDGAAGHTPPIRIIEQGEIRTITLDDAYDHHGRPCPGAAVAFQAVRYGLELLYEGEIPRRDDLVIITATPGGPMDMLDLLMKGDDKRQRTWPPAGMTFDPAIYRIDFYSKSRMQGVGVIQRDDLWPDRWFEMRERAQSGEELPKEEQRKRQADRATMIREFPRMDPEDMFHRTDIQHFVVWGQIEPGEIDRSIREQRRSAR